MSNEPTRDSQSRWSDDGPADDEKDPFENAEVFEEHLEERLFNDALSDGIDAEAHDVGRVYVARGTAQIDATSQDDGSKQIHESDDISPNWEDQGYWRCHTCGHKITSKAIAFIHASEDAEELVDNLPPAIRADVSELSRLNDYTSNPA